MPELQQSATVPALADTTRVGQPVGLSARGATGQISTDAVDQQTASESDPAQHLGWNIVGLAVPSYVPMMTIPTPARTIPPIR
jgi:hypothetical protein